MATIFGEFLLGFFRASKKFHFYLWPGPKKKSLFCGIPYLSSFSSKFSCSSLSLLLISTCQYHLKDCFIHGFWILKTMVLLVTYYFVFTFLLLASFSFLSFNFLVFICINTFLYFSLCLLLSRSVQIWADKKYEVRSKFQLRQN